MTVTAQITEETLSADVITQEIHINIVDESVGVTITDEQINVEIHEEQINIEFGDVVAINERALEQGIPYIDTSYLYVVFNTDVKRTQRTTFAVDYAFFETKPMSLADCQALFA